MQSFPRKKIEEYKPDPRFPTFRISDAFIEYCYGYAAKGYRAEAIAALVNILPSTFQSWLKHGKEQKKRFEEWLTKRMQMRIGISDAEVFDAIGNPPPKTETVHLFEEVARGYAEHELRTTQVMNQRIEDGDVKAAQWMLERRYGWSIPVENADDEELNDSCDIDELVAKISGTTRSARAQTIPAIAEQE